jgi:Tol biopolymer transport system component
MKNLFLIYISTSILLFSGCDNDNSTSPEPEDTSYNLAYEDSIIFSAQGPSNISTIYISYINGTGTRALTSNIVSRNPVWSHNKRKILFVGKRVDKENWGVYQINVNDYKINLIPTKDTLCESASYSPDMKYIAYSLYRQSNSSTIKLYNIGTGETSILLDNMPEVFHTLSWSPDSKKILLPDGVTIDIETRQLERLFQLAQGMSSLVWSPDGSKVLFSSGTPTSSSNIIIYNLETDDYYPIYESNESQYSPSWSKDNSRIIFGVYPGLNQGDPYFGMVNIDGTNFIRINYNVNSPGDPCWYK